MTIAPPVPSRHAIARRRIMLAAGAALLGSVASPALANSSAETIQSVARDVRNGTVRPTPSVLSADEKRIFAQIFAAIEGQRWDEAASLIETAPRGPMHAMARAELLLAPNSPKAELGPLLALVHDAPWLPQSEQLRRLAEKRGAVMLPGAPTMQKFAWMGSAPTRNKPRGVADSAAAALRAQLSGFIDRDDPRGGEALVEAGLASLSADAVTELRQRVAWAYYIDNMDGDALRVARQLAGAGGAWGAEAAWTHGLAAWRGGLYAEAAQAFDRSASLAGDDDGRASGYYWAARSHMAARDPAKVQSRMQAAARFGETFYGILAGEALGMEPIAARQSRASAVDWKTASRDPSVALAVGLSEIGQSRLADEALKYGARTGGSQGHATLLQVSRDLSLPTTQLWLAHNGPSGGRIDPLARYPAPMWVPAGGWRVDRGLVYAHALQESNFRSDAVSHANARGLMQVLPGTAREMAAARGLPAGNADLANPTYNLEYGQSFLEKLRDMGATEGLLPKVIAAYNAGPTPVERWRYEVRDKGDPLLFVESIPYWETRAYVGTILRNYWMYQQQDGKPLAAAAALAQNMWPRFPGRGETGAVMRLARSGNGQLANR